MRNGSTAAADAEVGDRSVRAGTPVRVRVHTRAMPDWDDCMRCDAHSPSRCIGTGSSAVAVLVQGKNEKKTGMGLAKVLRS